MSEKERIKEYWEERAKYNEDVVTSTTDDVYLRELEIRNIIEEIQSLSIKKGVTIADIGCGDGYSTINIAMKMPEYNLCGIDYSQNMIANAKKRLDADPDLAKRVSFTVGDVIDLEPCLADTLFPCVITDRCLINMESYEDQVRALAQISSHVAKDGYYIAIENFVEGHNNMNDARKAIGLPEINIRWHNLFFTEDSFEKAIQPFFELVEMKDFASSYYYATRVIYSKMCQMRGEKPDYLHDIHKLAVELPSFEKFSPIRLAILRRK